MGQGEPWGCPPWLRSGVCHGEAAGMLLGFGNRPCRAAAAAAVWARGLLELRISHVFFLSAPAQSSLCSSECSGCLVRGLTQPGARAALSPGWQRPRNRLPLGSLQKGPDGSFLPGFNDFKAA